MSGGAAVVRMRRHQKRASRFPAGGSRIRHRKSGAEEGRLPLLQQVTRAEMARGLMALDARPETGVTQDAIRLLVVQTALTLVAAVAFLLFRGADDAGASLAGGGVALALTLLHARRVRLATRATRERPGSEMLMLGIGMFERFAVAAALFALGIGYWDLAPLPMIAGFAACQIAWFLAGSLYRGDASGGR